MSAPLVRARVTRQLQPESELWIHDCELSGLGSATKGPSKKSGQATASVRTAGMDAISGAAHGEPEARVVTVGHLSVDLESETVLLRGRSLALTPHHRKLLLRLARDSGSFVHGAELRACAGIQEDRENKNLRNQVWRLRKRLAEAGCRLEGAARQGYRLVSASTSPRARTS